MKFEYIGYINTTNLKQQAGEHFNLSGHTKSDINTTCIIQWPWRLCCGLKLYAISVWLRLPIRYTPLALQQHPVAVGIGRHCLPHLIHTRTYCIRIVDETRDIRSNIAIRLRELLKKKGYIWPCISSRVLIQILYNCKGSYYEFLYYPPRYGNTIIVDSQYSPLL